MSSEVKGWSLPQWAHQNPATLVLVAAVLVRSFHSDSDNHSTGSVVAVVATASVAAAASVTAAAHDVRLPEVSVSAVPVVAAAASLLAVTAAVAALVVMVVVSFLLTLNAHVRYDHFGAVPHGHAIPGVVPAPVGRQVFPGSVDKKSTVGEKSSVREGR